MNPFPSSKLSRGCVEVGITKLDIDIAGADNIYIQSKVFNVLKKCAPICANHADCID